MIIAALMSSALLLSASTSAASGDEPHAPPAAAVPALTEAQAAQQQDDPLICRSELKPNSRFKVKVCQLKSVREARAREREEMWRKEFNGPVVKTGCFEGDSSPSC